MSLNSRLESNKEEAEIVGTGAEGAFWLQISEAYTILSDPEKKALYDKYAPLPQTLTLPAKNHHTLCPKSSHSLPQALTLPAPNHHACPKPSHAGGPLLTR